MARSSKNYRSFDMFAKPIDGITTKTSVGGAITILASTTAIVLFLSQIFLYYQLDTQNSLFISPSFPLNVVIPTQSGFSSLLINRSKKHHKTSRELMASINTLAANRVDVFVHITFPDLNCKTLDYSHNGAKFSTGQFTQQNGLAKFTKRQPTEYDYAKATSMPTTGLSRQKTSNAPGAERACTVRGTITVPRIGGELNFFMAEDAFNQAAALAQAGMPLDSTDSFTGGHKVHHYIHDVTFGDHFPLATNPLRDTFVEIEHESGVSLNQVTVKLVPTKYKRFARRNKDTYQIAVSNFIVRPEVLVHSNPLELPGMKMKYDFTPIAVHHVESRENFFVFLGSLVGIVGGTFVTVRLLSTLVVNSAQMMKKMD